MEISTLSRKILRELCTNSRITITELSEKLDISRKSAKERIAALEKELGINYVLELNYEALGFTTLHLVKLKFSKTPKAEVLRPVFANSKIVQFAALTRGQFDMVIFALAKHPKDFFKWEIGLWSSLAKYGINTASSEVTVMHLGFMPINNELIKESVLEEPYKAIILALNQNSRVPIRELSKKVNLSETLTKYYLKKLTERNVIRRYTAIVTKSPIKHNIIYFVNYTVKEGIQERIQNERRMMYWKVPYEFPLLSEFQLMFSTTGSDISFTWAVYDDYVEGFKHSVETHERIYKIDSPISKHAVITDIIKGTMPLRNIDMKENYDLTLGDASDL